MRSLALVFAIVATAHFGLSFASAQAPYAIAIHGGAGEPTEPEYQAPKIEILNKLLDQGTKMLADGAQGLDVVEALIKQMEDSELFNAGRGCVLNEQGQHELDASIMDGKTLGCGAVAGVKTTRYPISLARKVMTETRHVMLSGAGADQFAKLKGLEQAGPEHFVTPEQIKRLERWKLKQKTSDNSQRSGPRDEPRMYYGTVGVVVLDKHGNLAAGTSTGGLVGKRWGRIGDSPIIGAGTYADNKSCAVSGTGIGEEFIRHRVASDISARMKYAGKSLSTATDETIALLPDDCGGVICVDHEGNVLARHNTPAMSFAIANSKGVRQIQLIPEKK
ncbi:MAG: isoaspartyl peptidase/L-asparaginase [Pirellulales bacterium]